MKIKMGRSFGEGAAVFLIGLGILLLLPSQVEKPLVSEVQIPPSFLPMVVAIGFMLTGAGMAISSLSSKTLEFPFTKVEALRIFYSIGLLFLYSFLFSRIGFVVSSSLILGILAYLFGARNWVKIFLTMALVPGTIWFLLEFIFSIPLPRGLLF